jgi:hypothetical protein
MTDTQPPTTEGEMETIYLTPHCKDCKRDLQNYDVLLWCVDPQDPCEDCGKEWIKYTRATEQGE